MNIMVTDAKSSTNEPPSERTQHHNGRANLFFDTIKPKYILKCYSRITSISME